MKTMTIQKPKEKKQHKFISRIAYYNRTRGVMVINIPPNEQENVKHLLGKNVVVEVRDPL